MSRQLLIERAMQAVQARRATSISHDTSGARGANGLASPLAREAGTSAEAWLGRQTQAVEPSSAMPQLLCLARWPDLRQVQVTDVVMVARVCGLLSYSPSAERLIHRRLGVEREQLLPVLDWLRSSGCLRYAGTSASEPLANTEAAGDDGLTLAAPAGGSIWQRLMRKLAG
ncbi:MAG: hypothetical protein C4K60_14840 [Ideonella sp. MAG2]|nr:MAG: hypothetical protein C4K60_14840 [Ideonella sp. MAG2]